MAVTVRATARRARTLAGSLSRGPPSGGGSRSGGQPRGSVPAERQAGMGPKSSSRSGRDGRWSFGGLVRVCHHSVRPGHDGSAPSPRVMAKENWTTSLSSGRRQEAVAARFASQPVRPRRVAQSQWRVPGTVALGWTQAAGTAQAPSQWPSTSRISSFRWIRAWIWNGPVSARAASSASHRWARCPGSRKAGAGRSSAQRRRQQRPYCGIYALYRRVPHDRVGTGLQRTRGAVPSAACPSA